jgi:uncharacterized phage protein (TIGR01671 family)
MRTNFALHGKEIWVWNNYVRGYSTQMNEECFTFMQAIGLRDKADREIYEGDIVRAKSNRTKKIVTGVIKWRMWEAAFRLVVEADYCYRIDDIHKAEVIGNICENPELLN